MRPVSYSGLMTYAKCPSAFKRRYITKEEVAEGAGAPSPAALRGSAIHKGIEEFLLGNSEELPEDVEFYRKFFTDLRGNTTLKPECAWQFSHAWDVLPFSSQDGMIRGIADVMLQAGDVCYVYEFKTGKKYAEHDLQRALYGLAGLLLHPMAEECTVFTMYLDSHDHEVATFDGTSLGAYKWMWQRRVEQVWQAGDYPETPSWKCKYCPYSKERGGTCPN